MDAKQWGTLFGFFLILTMGLTMCNGVSKAVRQQEAIDALPENVASRAVEAERERAAEFLRKAEQDVFDAATPKNIAQWERAHLAVDPNWTGSWEQKQAEDRAAYDQAVATVYADDMRRELRDRPVIVVVSNP